jgi:hypothetical protein
MIARLALLLLVTTGCYSPETFVEARINATCTWYQRCEILNVIGYETVADCVDEYTADAEQSGDLGETCEPYDRGAAKDCVDDLNAAGCEEDFPYPGSCSEACPTQ